MPALDRSSSRGKALPYSASFQLSRLPCSSVSVSMATPIVASFRRAISSSMSLGTSYTRRSRVALFATTHSADSAWFAKDIP